MGRSDRLGTFEPTTVSFPQFRSLKSECLPYSDTRRRHPSADKLLAPRNALFDQGDWIKSILWDGENPQRAEYFTRLNLNLNDTQMLLEVHQPKGEPHESEIASRSNLY